MGVSYHRRETETLELINPATGEVSGGLFAPTKRTARQRYLETISA
jgi:hypothetical protein